jgi:hypothetical protein
MHTITITILEENANGKSPRIVKKEWQIRHNGDWSGDVKIVPPEGEHIECHNNMHDNSTIYDAEYVTMPAAILMQLAHQMVKEQIKSELIEFLESME